ALPIWVAVAKTYFDPAFRRQMLAEAAYVRGETRTPALQGEASAAPARLTGRYRELRDQAVKTLAEVNRQVGAAGDGFLRQQFEPLQPQLEAMVRRVETLCAAAQDLNTQASPAGQRALEDEVAVLDGRVKSAADPTARSHYESALQQKRKVQENLAWMRQAADRMEAELTALVGSLDRLRSDVVRVVTASRTGLPAPGAAAPEQLTDLTDQVAAIESAVHELEALKAEDRRLEARSRVV
ncbi:MAG: hypothetical protein HY814_06680, partial [Candidatus Riflebacteria bacterium]|nr:hypothetical protein [Candidatus Riflebacteria bacterium]